ncbi:MAG: hypothetical protein H7X80_00905 [bacterium]|nr:hypothetical protein [Candidatus Kapabacteria bacterium]
MTEHIVAVATKLAVETILAVATILSISTGCAQHNEVDSTLATTRATPVADVKASCMSEKPTGPRMRIASSDEPGRRLTITGTVLDIRTRRPVSGVTIYAYHTDMTGAYSRSGERDPRLCGLLRTGSDGRYVIETIMPGSYPSGGNPAHVHFELWGANVTRVHQEIMFDGDRYLTDEFVEREIHSDDPRGQRWSIIRPAVDRADGGLECERDFLVEAGNEH